MGRSIRRGRATMDPAKALQIISFIQKTPFEVLRELVDNALDSGGEVWVVLEEGNLVVMDNGTGLLPEMDEDSRGMLELFLQDRATSGSRDDVRQLVKASAMATLEWMMRGIALSMKEFYSAEDTRGMLGIGVQSVRSIGVEAVVRSRASLELARGFLQDEDPITAELHMPNLSQLRDSDTSWDIRESDFPLVDWRGREIPSGTVVEVKLNDDLRGFLRPALVVTQLRKQYQAVISRGRKITLVDRVTREGKRGTGVEIPVEVSSFQGEKVLDELVTFVDGKNSFQVQIHYGSRGDLPLMLRRRDNNVCPLASLPEFAGDPWRLKSVSGFVEFPRDASIEEAPWSTDKQVPLASPVKTKWVRAVLALASKIEEAISLIESESVTKGMETTAASLARSLPDALNEFEIFQGVLLPRGVRGTPPKQPTGERPPKVSDPSIVVCVLNEHNIGVSGMEIQLLNGRREELELRQTGRAGRINFGERNKGRKTVMFFLRIRSKEGITVLGPDEYKCELSRSNPGGRWTFRVRTGEDPPEKKGLSEIHVGFRPMSDPDQLWESRLSSGVLEINLGNHTLRRLLREGNEAAIEVMVAQAIGGAVAEYCLPGMSTFFVLQQAAQLATVLVQQKGAS